MKRLIFLILIAMMCMTVTAVAGNVYRTPDGVYHDFGDSAIEQEIERAKNVQKYGVKYTGTGVNADGTPIPNDIGYSMPDGYTKRGFRDKNGKPTTVEEHLKGLEYIRDNQTTEPEFGAWTPPAGHYGEKDEKGNIIIKKKKKGVSGQGSTQIGSDDGILTFGSREEKRAYCREHGIGLLTKPYRIVPRNEEDVEEEK